MARYDIEQYLNRQTLIAGDVNSGKSTLTTSLIELFSKAGYTRQMAVLDLAPNPVQGIGGKLPPCSSKHILYLTDDIAAPRLMGENAAHTLQLAKQNAQKIEKLFEELTKRQKEILFVNDATLYLQHGSLSRFLKILAGSSTRIINVYYGSTFEKSKLTLRERQLTDALIAVSDKVVML